MAITTLDAHAVEGGTYVLTISFYDEDDASMTPTEAKWTLTDEAGNVINDQKDEVISPLQPVVEVVLQGSDLDADGKASRILVFTVKGKYNSDLGTALPLHDHVQFVVDGLVA